MKKSIRVGELNIAYSETGDGSAVVFLHGNPTSSYLWRNITSALNSKWRCIAPDLLGMGDSDKLPDSGPNRYTFLDHYTVLESVLHTLLPDERLVLVMHDWGSALGFHWANQHRDRIRGLCYMEAIVRPLTWDEFPDQARSVFQGFRSPAGEELVLERNLFVERVLPGSILRQLSGDEMQEYRRPFVQAGEARRPTLTWPRQIPIDGEPPEVVEIVENYAVWLSSSELPKLFINADPGALLTGSQREFCRTWPNQTEVTVRGSHFIQEDSPDEIATAIGNWLDALDVE